MFQVNDCFCPDEDDADEDFVPLIDILDAMVTSYFEREDVNAPENLAIVYDMLRKHDDKFSKPPDTYSAKELLNSLLSENPLTAFQLHRQETLNKMIKNTETSNIKAFINLIWYHCFLLLRAYIVSNPDENTVNFTRQASTETTAQFSRV